MHRVFVMNVVIRFDDVEKNVFDGGDVEAVQAEMFGAIQINHNRSDHQAFLDIYDEFELGLLRYPGGTLAETGRWDFDSDAQKYRNFVDGGTWENYAYSLNYPELMHPDAIAQNKSQSFSDALQTALDTQSVLSVILPTDRYAGQTDQAHADVLSFLTKLFVEQGFNDGQPLPKIILDIGNEHYHPEEYAQVSAAMLQAVQSFRDTNPEFDFEVGLQVLSSDEEVTIFNESLPRQEQMENLPLEASERFFSHFEDMDLLRQVDIVRLHDLGHNLNYALNLENNAPRRDAVELFIKRVEQASQAEVDLYFSAWTVDDGPRQAATGLALFSQMITFGADYAATWGLGRASSNFHSNGNRELTQFAHVYALMADSLVGTTLVGTSEQSASLPVNSFAFAGEDKSVIFLAASDFTGSYTVHLEGIDAADLEESYAWIETVSSDQFGASVSQRDVLSLDIEGDEVSFTYDFKEDPYEVVRVIIEGRDGAQYGFESSDYAQGSDMNNIINGGAGDDVLSGGAGDDILIGEAGADVFVFQDGFDRDVIRDFDPSSGDQIDLSAVSEISGYGDLRCFHLLQDGDDALIDAGGGDVIRLQGVDIEELSLDDFIF